MRATMWILPASSLKNRMLRSLGHDVHPSAIARSNLVWRVSRFDMAEGSRIGKWNMIKDLRALSIGSHASVGRLNVISAHPVYKRLYSNGASLSVGVHAFITSRHQLDCSGAIALGEFASMAGHGTMVLTHSIDVGRDVQAAYPVIIGERSFVGARCLLLGGGTLPPRSVLAAGSVLARTRDAQDSGLWAGVPAKHKGDVKGSWFDREVTGTSRVYIPETGEVVENAI